MIICTCAYIYISLYVCVKLSPICLAPESQLKTIEDEGIFCQDWTGYMCFVTDCEMMVLFFPKSEQIPVILGYFENN